MPETKNISVVHLVWLPYGINLFRAFVDSYLENDASYPHELIIVFNGLNEPHAEQPEAYIEYMEYHNIKAHRYFHFPNGQDIEVYKKVAKDLDEGLIIFLNSFSEIKATGWLKKYVDNMHEDIGIISASGSFQSYYSSVYQKHPWHWESKKGSLYNFRKYKLFIKAFFYWRFLFKPFPNPHLRTNAFMVRRNEFLSMDFEIVDTKFKAYKFENGRSSMTNQYVQKGLKPVVMDKYGRIYEQCHWKESSTFWINDQQNLLISDNQTGLYQDADEENRKSMTKLAWGNE